MSKNRPYHLRLVGRTLKQISTSGYEKVGVTSKEKRNIRSRRCHPVKNLRLREPVVAGFQGYGLLTVHIVVICIFYVCALV